MTLKGLEQIQAELYHTNGEQFGDDLLQKVSALGSLGRDARTRHRPTAEVHL